MADHSKLRDPFREARNQDGVIALITKLLQKFDDILATGSGFSLNFRR